MAKYTVELRFIVEQFLDDKGLRHTEPNWQEIHQELGLSDYPIFDENYRWQLNRKIIRHFYVREIGFETFYLFRWYLHMKMHEIMPYYNQLYLSEKIKFDPLSTRDIEYREIWGIDNTRDTDSNWTSKVDSTGKNHDREIYQDTPMELLDEPSPNPVESLDYATTATYNDGDSQAKQNSSGDNTVDETKNEQGNRTKTEKGCDRPGAEMLMMYRDSFLNIDMMVINELETLFMGIG